MTPWLRITFRCIRLLLVLAATLPAYDIVTGYATGASAAESGPGGSAGPGHPNRPAPKDADHSARGGANGPDRPAHPEPTAREDPDGPRFRLPDPADHGHGHDHRHRGSFPDDPAPIPVPSDSASASYHSATAVQPTRAGSWAGEGRMRPGRPDVDGPAAEVEGDDDPVPTRAAGTGRAEDPETANLPSATPTASTVPDEAGVNPADRPTQNAAPEDENGNEPVLQILPLGTGLVLIGLGLGLAFLGLRLRRN
ncbi:hypothetical protein [Streptomyces sp. NPDC046759]|uniref:hypothetical protein n=1 Tax=Streptomyces sp. NPDC046759 TaxID=3155019 RepID=UPI003401CDC9